MLLHGRAIIVTSPPVITLVPCGWKAQYRQGIGEKPFTLVSGRSGGPAMKDPEKILSQIVTALQEGLGGRLVAVVLYGASPRSGAPGQ